MRNCNAVGINQVLLQVYCCKCKADDIIMVMSDGVHDNLHPGMLNVSPRDLKINYDTWQLAQENTIDVETVASNFRVELLKEIILKSNNQISTSTILDATMKFSHEITKSSREFMQTNPGKRLPRDYDLYPGKMDHTTSILFRVGYISEPSPLELLSSPNSPSRYFFFYISPFYFLSIQLDKDSMIVLSISSVDVFYISTHLLFIRVSIEIKIDL